MAIHASRCTLASVLVATFICVAGCTPRYDWRETRSDHFLVTFPARVDTVNGNVEFIAAAYPMAMTAARISDTTFLVARVSVAGTGAVPAGLPAFLEAQFLSNIEGVVIAHSAEKVRRVNDHDVSIVAESIEANGHANGREVHLSGRFFDDGNGAAYEIVVIGPSEELSTPEGREAIATFMSSLKLV